MNSMKTSPESLANPHVAAMSAYTPGLQPTEAGWVKLNTNELPVPPSPKVTEAIHAELHDRAKRLRLYPNPTSGPLRTAVATHHGIEASQVLIGNGADDVLNLLIRTFCSSENPCGMTVPSYSLYGVLANAQNAQMLEVSFDRSMVLPVDAIAACPANLFLLTSPNAPTGIAFDIDTIGQLAERFEGILAVDETYAPFAAENAVRLLAEHPNLVIIRSFSKAYALAGMRVGYALASPEVISLLDRVRDSYNVDRLAQAAALGAISDQEYYSGVIQETLVMRDSMETWYKELGWFVYPSQANFHFVEPVNANGETGVEVASSLYDHLRARKVLVRAFPKLPLTASFLRISLGSEAEMATLRCVIQDWLKS